MSVEHELGHAPPSWFTATGETDFLAWFSMGLILLAMFGLISLYAAFDRWAEHRASGTPLAKTIPTLLTIALLYEIFPLDHFSVLLPLSAVLLALVADWSRFHLVGTHDVHPANDLAIPDGSRAAPSTSGGSAENA